MKKLDWLAVIHNIFRALRNRNYFLFFSGQGISQIGTQMQRIAISWLVYRLTNSVLLLGVIGFTNQIPTFLLSPVAGVFADRWNRHRTLVVTQTLAMLQALILAILVMSDKIQIWQIVVLGTMLGVVNAFDTPVRQAFVIDMVERKEDLGNAIALNSSLVNGARFWGPAIAGILISLVGEGMCFLLNAISYVAVIWALIAMRITVKKKEAVAKDVWYELREGCTYAFDSKPIRDILLFLGLVSFMGRPYTVLMPVFATDILHGGAHTLGFLLGATGVGALMGAVFLASRQDAMGLGRWIYLAATILGAGLITLSFTTVFATFVFILVITGFGMMVQTATSNTVLQSIVEESKRGRIMSFYTLSIRGMTSFGSLLAGILAHKIGTTNTILFGGICCIIGAAIFAMKASLPLGTGSAR